MKIAKERIVSIIIRFFKERKKLTNYKLAKEVEVDQKSLKAWELQERESIHFSSVEHLLSGLQSDISSTFEEFSEFVIAELEKFGVSREYTWKIFDVDRNIFTIVEQLLEIEIFRQKTLQEEIGTSNIIQKLKNFFAPYREYFQVNEKGINEGEAEFVYSPLVYSSRQSKEVECFVHDLNYLILKFPNAYYVGIILSNYVIDYSDARAYSYYLFMIEKLKTQNDLKMLLFITDIDKKRIPFGAGRRER